MQWQCHLPQIWQVSAAKALQVRYNERFTEELHLPVEKLDFGQVKPQLQADDGSISHAWPPVARPVLQQDAQHLLPLVITSTSKPVQVVQPALLFIRHLCMTNGCNCAGQSIASLMSATSIESLGQCQVSC